MIVLVRRENKNRSDVMCAPKSDCDFADSMKEAEATEPDTLGIMKRTDSDSGDEVGSWVQLSSRAISACILSTCARFRSIFSSMDRRWRSSPSPSFSFALASLAITLRRRATCARFSRTSASSSESMLAAEPFSVWRNLFAINSWVSSEMRATSASVIWRHSGDYYANTHRPVGRGGEEAVRTSARGFSSNRRAALLPKTGRAEPRET